MILDGTIVAAAIREKIAKALAHSEERPPGLAFVLVGDNPASQSYIAMKKKSCREVGILSFDRELPATISQETLLQEISQLNKNSKIDGILIQLPLPSHLSTPHVLEAVDPEKDVDGFHPLNIGKVSWGEEDTFAPCTPLGIVELLSYYKIATEGRHIVIVGRSNIVGKPLATLLLQKKKEANATVTVAHSFSQRLPEITKSADILIAAMGKAEFIKETMVKEQAVVIDVGINRINGKIVGDVDFKQVARIASAISPVPGGIGPMTIAMLLSNTFKSFMKKDARRV